MFCNVTQTSISNAFSGYYRTPEKLDPTWALAAEKGRRMSPAAQHASDAGPGVTVIVCAYTEARWTLTRAALDSVLAQEPGPDEVLLVVDHNAALAGRARREAPGAVTVLENDQERGLSGARNTGLAAAAQPIAAFLDDDAEARAGWLAALVGPYGRAEVVATGGSVQPSWPERRPGWLPGEFDWVVGCSYIGLPETTEPVRNPIGASMSLRTGAALEVGGFDAAVGRTRTRPGGCEETELCIRLTARRPGSVVLYVPAAVADHHVARERVAFGYFLRRCWHEGLSKAAVVRLAGAPAGLERERRQITVVLPAALRRDLRAAVRGELAGLARIAATMAGLSATSASYLLGRVTGAGDNRHPHPADPAAGAAAQPETKRSQPDERVPL
jgi:GT2 family glycosyltransferase